MDDWATAAGLLRLSAQLVDGIQDGMARRGYDDVRPMHGFAFAAVAGRELTTTELAAELGVTKQAAAQLVDHLVRRGYLTRRQDPHDGRAQLLALTRRGRACTRAAEQAAAEVVAGWRSQLSRATFDALSRGVGALALPGRLRPLW